MNDITKRFLEVYNHLITEGVVSSPSEFAREIKVSNSTITEICKKRTDAGIKPISGLLNRFSKVNATWLFKGIGKMFSDDNYLALQEPSEVYTLKTDRALKNQHIPLFKIEASAGLVELFQTHSDVEPVDTIHIPYLPKCDGAVFVTGDSMYPLIKSGDIVMYKKINEIENNIFWGQMYLISIVNEDEEYVMVKYIQKSEKGIEYIKLVSQNKHHGDKDVPLKDVKALAIIKASIRINTMS